MEDHIPLRPDGSLLKGRQTSKQSSCDAVFHENNFNSGLKTAMNKKQKLVPDCVTVYSS